MANSPEHKAAVTQRAALIAQVLAPLGNLDPAQAGHKGEQGRAKTRPVLRLAVWV